jgi:3-keto-disaccharide hydrolase
MFRTFRSAFFAAFAVGLALVAQSPAGADKDFKDLFNGKDLTGWKYIPEKADKTYTVVDGYIKVSGQPAGYFYTDKSYKNYVLKFDWRYKRPANLEDDKKFGGNSGLLVHITGAHKVWPNSLEVQGMNRDHGSFLSIGKTGLKDYKFNREALEKARNKVGEWNTTEVSVKDGDVTAKVNAALISTGKITLVEGPFGFQSEGAELHFKNIKIKVLD